MHERNWTYEINNEETYHLNKQNESKEEEQQKNQLKNFFSFCKTVVRIIMPFKMYNLK